MPGWCRLRHWAYEGSVADPDPSPVEFIFDNGEEETYYPGNFLCQSPQTSCTNGEDVEADSLYQTIADVFHFFWNNFKRNSFDNGGGVIVASVHSKATSGAMWSYTQAVFVDKYTEADDIVAHELTHGIVQSEANLFNYYQSGAIAQSLADLWGEYFDQTNGTGNDTDMVNGRSARIQAKALRPICAILLVWGVRIK